MNVWILGAISDQYQYVVNRQVRNKRKILLGLNIATTALATIIIIAVVGVLLNVLMLSFGALQDVQLSDTMIYDLLQEHLGTVLILFLLCIPLSIVGIVYTVFFYIALYDVFRSCDPNNSTMFLVLSLVGNVVIEGAYCIFTMICKEKDLGMPPRKQPEAVAEEIPTEPVNNP